MGETGGVDVSLEPYIGHLVTVAASIDSIGILLIFDTGGGETIVTPEVAERSGCVSSGRSVGFRMSGERVDVALCTGVTITIGGVHFVSDEVGVWDVNALLPPDVPTVDGVFSLATLAAQPFTLRLAEHRLTLETSQSLARQVLDMNRLQSRVATGTDGDELTVFVRGAVADTAWGWFLIDSGNLDVVQIAPHLHMSERIVDEPLRGDLTLDGVSAVPTSFRVSDIIYDGVLSEEFLRGFVWTFDLSTNRVWAARIP